MKRVPFPAVAGAAVLFAATLACADQVQMRNGDQYFGSIISLDKETLVIQSDVLGRLRLPREKVAFVNLGAGPVAQQPLASVPTNNVSRPPALTVTNGAAGFSAAIRQMGGSSNLLQQVEAQYLNEATPEAKEKFHELFSGLLTGKLSVSDIRSQAQATADQVRSVRKDLGEDAGGLIDGYLAILDAFIKETAPSPTSATNAPLKPLKPKANPLEDE